MSYSDDYSKAIKYSADDLRGLRESKDAQSMIKAGLGGENTPLLALADHFDEHGHPLGNYIRRVANGEGVEGQDLAQSVLGMVHTARPDTNRIQSDYPVLEDHTSPYVNHRYYKLPNGQHMFHITVGGEKKEGKRSFLLPVNEDEVNQYVADLHSHNAPDWTDANIKDIEAVKNNSPIDAPYFDKRLKEATTPNS